MRPENGVYRRRFNHEREREFDSPNALNVTNRQTDCATLVTFSENPKTHHKELYSEPNPMEGEIKEDQNPGGRMG
jgi:hypothetical protein